MPNIWSRINTVLLICVLLAIAGMMALRVSGGPLDPPGTPASTDSIKLPGTPISSVPYTISQPGHYYVTRNLTLNSSGIAISVAAPNVTLDLGGFRLQGANAPNSAGVAPTAFVWPVEVANGDVVGFGTGIDWGGGSHVRIKNINAFSNGIGIRINNHGVVSDCTAALNSSYGIHVVASLNWVQDCMVVDSGSSGIYVTGTHNTIQGSQVIRNDTANSPGEYQVKIAGSKNVLRRSTAASTVPGQGDGIVVGSADNVYCGFDLLVGASGNQVLDNVQLC